MASWCVPSAGYRATTPGSMTTARPASRMWTLFLGIGLALLGRMSLHVLAKFAIEKGVEKVTGLFGAARRRGKSAPATLPPPAADDLHPAAPDSDAVEIVFSPFVLLIPAAAVVASQDEPGHWCPSTTSCARTRRSPATVLYQKSRSSATPSSWCEK